MARQMLGVRPMALVLISLLLILALLVGVGGSKATGVSTPGSKPLFASDEVPSRGQGKNPALQATLDKQESEILDYAKGDVHEGSLPQGTSGPNPAFSASNYNPCANQSVQFVALNTAGTTYAWDFGDGSQANDPTRSVTHSYMGAGAYNVTLTVTSSSGSASSSKQVFVTNCVPMGGSQANWFFGFFGELHFNTGEPLPGDAALTHNTIFTSEASITQSDASGKLLFYSDGKQVWNNQHVQVCGGLRGGDHPAQALSVPDPNPSNPGSFYLISMPGYSSSDRNTSPSPEGGFGYTKVGVNGSNQVSCSVNTIIAPPAGADKNIAEMITAVPGCGTNYWIIVHGSFLDADADFRHALFVYPLNAGGLGPPAVFSIVGSALFGQIKASPDGTRIAYGSGDIRSSKGSNSGFSYVLDFNRNTGMLSNPRVINRRAYGVSFSPNSELLYFTESISGSEKIFQYDLNNNLSEKLVAEVPAAYSALQLGPDNKIYVALNGGNHLAVIDNPDKRNTLADPNACGYNFNGPSLNTPPSSTAVISGFGLPNMIDARKPSVNFCPHLPLVISRFRENGPGGMDDEFVEIFNPSSSTHIVASVNGSGYGVFASAGNGTTSNDLSLACRIPDGTVIPARGYFLCAGASYSLGNLGRNGGVAGATAVGDAAILVDIPNDAGLALFNVSTPPTSNSLVFDKVGFMPYGASAPAPEYPSGAPFFCEGTCLQPVGDASLLGACTNPSGLFPVVAAGPACYGQSGQYEFLRRQTAFDSSAGTLHRDTDNNADDFIFVSPSTVTNAGQAITGILGVNPVLGAAGPQGSAAPPDSPLTSLTQMPFDVGSQLGPRNAERNYGHDPTIANSANDPHGTFLLRFRFTNNSGSTITGLRFRLDNVSTLCGAQTTIVGTGDARNLSSSSDCGGGNFTAILKLLNSTPEVVVDSGGTAWIVNGTVMEDLSMPSLSPAPPGTGPLSPFGGGVDNSIIIGHADNAGFIGDGVTGGVGNFGTTLATSGPTSVLRVKVKFGVVRSGRFIVLITPMAKISPSP
ncbi:MAG: PKD domain-containing protein [Acidobacteriota bacterium]